MYKNKRILAVIPARGGSKGIPRKNIMKLKGKPLIFYSINAAIKSQVFDRIIVSTDDKEIANISKKYGAEVPFIRPAELATSTADSMDVVVHAIKWLENEGEEFDYVMKLQPTSPLRTEQDIKKVLKMIIKKEANSIISVSKCEHHPLWTNKLDKNLKMNNFIKEDVRSKNRQELPEFYRINGAIFLSKVDILLNTKNWYGEKSYAYIMDAKRSIDIDTEIDLKLAEILMDKNKNN